MKRSSVVSAAVAVGLGVFVASAVQAGEASGRIAPHAERWEARIGGGIYDAGVFVPHDFNGGTLNGEILAPSPGFLAWLGSPRPYVGADVALASDPVHFLYAGLNWEARLTEGLYVGFSAGGSVNTGRHIGPRDLGSNVLFHLQASAGVDVTESTAFQVYFNHFSNAELAGANDGFENAGARLVLRF